MKNEVFWKWLEHLLYDSKQVKVSSYGSNSFFNSFFLLLPKAEVWNFSHRLFSETKNAPKRKKKAVFLRLADGKHLFENPWQKKSSAFLMIFASSKDLNHELSLSEKKTLLKFFWGRVSYEHKHTKKSVFPKWTHFHATSKQSLNCNLFLALNPHHPSKSSFLWKTIIIQEEKKTPST